MKNTLQLPTNYTELEQEEMQHLEGGRWRPGIVVWGCCKHVVWDSGEVNVSWGSGNLTVQWGGGVRPTVSLTRP